ncbi:hypothetical protein DFAR_3630009 [Desulfarculales bacterium]
MSVRHKLWAGFSTAILVTMLVEAIDYGELSGQGFSFEKILKQDYPCVSLSREIEIGVLQCRRAEKDFFLNIGKAEAQKRCLERFEAVSSALYSKSQRLAALASAEPDPEINSVR